VSLLGLGLDIWTTKVRGFGLDHEAHVFGLGNEDQVIGILNLVSIFVEQYSALTLLL